MTTISLFTADQVLKLGLEIAGWDMKRQQRLSRETNVSNFNDAFGVVPIVYSQIWEDLETTAIIFNGEKGPESARIDTTRRSCTITTFLKSIHFLKKYDTEKDRSGRTGNCDRFCRDWGWYFLKRVAALREAKIVWPGNWTTTFIISLDGVMCRFHEQKHPTYSKDPAMYAYKFNGPGLGYELALSLYTNNLVWLKGPYPPGPNPDRKVYESELRQKIPDGKKAVVDGGYRKKTDPKLSVTNAHDPRELRKFKARAKVRQESFHSRIKRFEAVSCGDFRHGMDRHRICFEAICVICQYEMELVSPLFDV